MVSQGSFDIKIAAKEPSIRKEEFEIVMKKIEGIDKEKNRCFLYYDMDSGNNLAPLMKQIQHEMLCSMDTDFIKVSYKLEATVLHEGVFGSNAEVPSISFPVVITRDAKGEIDSGT